MHSFLIFGLYLIASIIKPTYEITLNRALKFDLEQLHDLYKTSDLENKQTSNVTEIKHMYKKYKESNENIESIFRGGKGKTTKKDKIKPKNNEKTTKKTQNNKKKPQNVKNKKTTKTAESVSPRTIMIDESYEVTTPLLPLPPVTKGPDYDKMLENADFGYVPVTYDNNVKLTADAVRPYMAQLKPRAFTMRPLLCTCVCIAKRIFISAATCLNGLTVGMISIEYLAHYLKVYAIVLSDNPSPRWFDEIGLVVSEDAHSMLVWQPIKLFDIKRTDDYYKWFDEYVNKYEYSPNRTHEVIGYFANPDWDALNTRMRCADMFVGIRFCYAVFEGRVPPLPCYSKCRSTWYADYVLRVQNVCDTFFSGPGYAVINKVTHELLGIATWSMGSHWGAVMPVGFSIPNSDKFYKNFECAKKIVNKTTSPERMHESKKQYVNLQNIC